MGRRKRETKKYKVERREEFGSVADATKEELPIDEAWQAACAKRLEEMGARQAELATHIGCSQSSVSATLTNPRRSSPFAHAISLALKVRLPLEARVLLVARRAKAEKPEAIERIIEILEAQYPERPTAPKGSDSD